MGLQDLSNRTNYMTFSFWLPNRYPHVIQVSDSLKKGNFSKLYNA